MSRHVMETLKQSHGKELRPLANNQHQLVIHVNERPWR